MSASGWAFGREGRWLGGILRSPACLPTWQFSVGRGPFPEKNLHYCAMNKRK